MSEEKGMDIREIVRQTLEEYVRTEQQRSEPAYRAEVQDERRRREGLEQRVNQLIEENRKARAAADEAERSAHVRGELQRMGVSNIDLAFRAVKDDIYRTEDGQLQAKGHEGKPLQDYLSGFLQENPELLPARIAGGSGVKATTRGNAAQPGASTMSLDRIRPGMNKEEMDRMREEIVRLSSQSLRGI